MPTTDHDPIDFTFADDGDLVRKAPKATPEDPVEKRLAAEVKAAPFIAEATGIDGDHAGAWNAGRCSYIDLGAPKTCTAIEIRHGSGKVKV